MAEQKRFISVDVSKRNFEVAIVRDDTSQIIRKKYKATTEARQEFVASLRKDDVVAMETRAQKSPSSYGPGCMGGNSE